VNRAFSRLIEASLETDQPAYEPIDPPPDPEDVPSVLALRFPAPAFADSGPELLGAEAAALAAFARRVAEGEFTVRDPREGVPRPSRAGDLMVLAPRLTQVRYLEEALGEEDLRFTVEGGKSFFGRQEVHEVLAVLRSIDDVSDRVSLVAALRSSFFGVSDAEIVAHFLARGRLHLAEGRDAGSETSLLASALETLWALHRARLTLSVPALVERLYDDTRVLAALTTLRRGEAQVANLQKVVALARHAESLGILTLRGFTRLLEERSAGALEEPDLPTTRPGDEETVRILSIHKAKGLEAPVVALYDQAANLQTRSDVIPLWSEGKVAVGFVEGFRPPGWKRLQEQDRGRALAEGRRLLYVACTRARDLLVVPRPPRDARTGSFWRDLWPFLDASPPSDVIVLDADTIPRSADEGPPERPAPSPPPESDLSAERWVRAREETVRMASRRPLAPVAATRFAARLAPPPVDAPVGGPGREFGRLVHRILEWIPLDASGRAEAMALALAPRFGLDDDAAREAADQVIRTLAHPILERARRADRCWRELPLWLPEGDELVEGVVDMVFQEVRGLVIVDYKTDHILAAQALAQAAHHAGQLQVYGRGLAHAAGLPVVERLVLFTVLGQAVPV
jgi:ATP-dependent exoDNAse (exonuclease V) beta subunit